MSKPQSGLIISFLNRLFGLAGVQDGEQRADRQESRRRRRGRIDTPNPHTHPPRTQPPTHSPTQNIFYALHTFCTHDQCTRYVWIHASGRVF